MCNVQSNITQCNVCIVYCMCNVCACCSHKIPTTYKRDMVIIIMRLYNLCIMIGCYKIPSSRNLATYRVENIQQKKVNTPPHKIRGSHMCIHKSNVGAPLVPPLGFWLIHLK